MSAVIEQLKPAQSEELRVISTDTAALVLDPASIDSMYRLAEIMAKGRSTIPDHFKGNPGDCMAIVMQAVQWRMNPFAVAQKTHLVNGVLGYEAQLVNAVVQSSGITKDRFHYKSYGDWTKIIGKTKVISVPAKGEKKAYEFRVPDYSMADEDGLGINVWATLKGESEPRILDLLLSQASVRNSPLWASDPKQQLAYLAVKRWTRLYAPDVILGVYTKDELEESQPKERDITPQKAVVNVAPIIADALKTKTDADAAKFWRDHNPMVKDQPADHARLKQAIVDHRTAMKLALEKESARTVEMHPAEPKDEAKANRQSDEDFDDGLDGGYVPQ